MAAEAGARPVGATAGRVEAIDLLRGLVMVVMALDHTRDFLTDPRVNPLDIRQTTPELFLTRWVTHFCAPVFVFLAGTGAFLHGTRLQSKARLAAFLVTRGLWLVALEFTLVHLGWFFNLGYPVLVGQVIWAIGWSMVLLAGLCFLPTGLVALLGVAVVAGHNALAPLLPKPVWGEPDWPAFAQLRPGVVYAWGDGSPPAHVVFIAYPVIPWLGIMLLGYGFGTLWAGDPRGRRLRLVLLGSATTAAFVALRWAGVYGDPNPWAPGRDPYPVQSQWTALLADLLGFLNCEKYPPSLLYVLMTLGPAVLGLAAFDGRPGPAGRVLVTFGRVPLFYYLLHVPLIHVLALALAYPRYGDVSFLLTHPMIGGRGFPPDYGSGLPAVYLAWAGVVAALYPLCRWFEGVKRRNRSVWLSYL